jgi:excisionase family DNA binding protein
MSPVICRSLLTVPKSDPGSNLNKRGYNVREGAVYCGVSVWQIRQWIHSGELKAAAIGNKHILDKASLDRLLDELFKAA